MGDAIATNHFEGPLGGETLLVGHHRATEDQSRQQYVQQAAHPGPVRWGVENRGFIELHIEEELESQKVALKNPMGMQGAFGVTRAARRVQQQGRVLRRCVDRAEFSRVAVGFGQRPLTIPGLS